MEETKAIANATDKALSLTERIFGPWLTRRQANADAETGIQGALARQVIDLIDEFPNRPEIMDMIATCGGRVGVNNLLRILQLAQSQLNDDAKPESVSEDWFANFRENTKTCSDEDFAKLWASLLAGEANHPGFYSRRTVNILGDMDTWSAHAFASLCKYVLTTETGPQLVVPRGSIRHKVGDHVLAVTKGLGLIDFVVGHGLQTSRETNVFGYDGGLLVLSQCRDVRHGDSRSEVVAL